MSKYSAALKKMTVVQRKEYARRSGTSFNYLKNHILRPNPTRFPRRELLVRLGNSISEATEGECALLDVVGHFMPEIYESSNPQGEVHEKRDAVI